MRVRWGWTCGLGLALLVQGGWAQSGGGLPQPPTTTEEALRAMFDVAGVIFTGSVSGVRVRGGSGGATGVVEVDFTVDDAIQGVSGSTYTMLEWNGRWASGETPFSVGQRYLMLLYAPGASGLTSPVGGMDGAIPIRGIGAGVGAAPPPNVVGQQTVAGAASVNAAAQTQVDLRWVATRVARGTGYSAPVAAHPVLVRGNLVGAGAGASAITAAAPGTAHQSLAYKQVLTMVRGWEQERDANR